MHNDRMSSESGFTLIELIVVMMLTTIILFGVFTMFDSFSSDSARQLRQTDANDQARRAIDDVVRDLRQSATISRADGNDLVYTVFDPASGYRTERFCLSPSNDVYHARSVATPASPGNPCPSGGSIWTVAKISTRGSTNSTANPIFRYDSTDPTKVKSVGITLSLDTSGGGHTNQPTTLRSSAVMRRASGTLQVGDEDLTADCTSTGALLSLNITGIGAVAPVTVTYANSGGIALGTGLLNVPIPAGVTRVVATVTDALGVTQTVTKDIECG
jgi:prepilin-type N-terminal cleavage/methylation domain-containing protein